MLRNGLLRYILYTCPNPNVTRVQSATQWTASVHTLHMSKPYNVTSVQSATQWTASVLKRSSKKQEKLHLRRWQSRTVQTAFKTISSVAGTQTLDHSWGLLKKWLPDKMAAKDPCHKGLSDLFKNQVFAWAYRRHVGNVSPMTYLMSLTEVWWTKKKGASGEKSKSLGRKPTWVLPCKNQVKPHFPMENHAYETTW